MARHPRPRARMLLLLAPLLLSGCGSLIRPASERTAVPPAPTSAKSSAPKGGGYYQDDGPGDNAPADLAAIPDAVPKDEPLHRFANNPYSVFGRDYVPLRKAGGYRARGTGSWYGRKFHGQKTSSGERYDMYGMTAAHPTLPIPSYARVSNPANGRSVVVRINDRGPFHADRLIDLSYTAAWKLGYIGSGSTLVEVESLRPGDALPPPPPAAAEDPIARLIASQETRPLPETRDARGHFLQLGAFGNRDNAETFLARVGTLPGVPADKLGVHSSGPLHRVQLGPWADAAEARRAADGLRDVLGLTPVVVQR